MKRNTLMAVTGSLLAIVLAAGVYTAVQLIREQNTAAEIPSGAQVYEDVFDDGSGNPVTVKTVILPAEELPTQPAATAGVLVRQEDNSYFVGTGNVSVSINVVNDEATTAVDHSGPEIEVVASRDTQFYRDVTEVSFVAAESKEQTLQQEVIPVDQPETMPAGANIQVWGEQRGDRVVAAVIVYAEPQ